VVDVLVGFSKGAVEPECSNRAGTSFLEAFEPEVTDRIAPVVAGDVDAPVVAGYFDAPVVAGDFAAPVVAGDFNAPVVAGDCFADPTVVMSAPEVAGDFLDPSLKETTLWRGASS
jgi:hypothetical protein